MPTSHEETGAALGNPELVSFERLIRVETKLDALLERRSAEHEEFAKDVHDHEMRLRTLERVWWKATGIAAVVAGIVGAGASAAVAGVIGG